MYSTTQGGTTRAPGGAVVVVAVMMLNLPPPLSPSSSSFCWFVAPLCWGRVAGRGRGEGTSLVVFFLYIFCHISLSVYPLCLPVGVSAATARRPEGAGRWFVNKAQWCGITCRATAAAWRGWSPPRGAVVAGAWLPREAVSGEVVQRWQV
ncbi:hypothetical protein E2C01_015588 [Portunus trituberculatus]|uniref:Uncharacterized protein n=1 Tax=Portunus trituberculatus TaxID=210409 RepID=A0A5B7DLY6_PORTR|nr:hypothetical protein [Portunus trituberculatus]